MTALADLSDIVNRCTGGNSGTPKYPYFWIQGRVSGAAASAAIIGYWIDLWQYEKYPNGAGAPPGGTARNPTNATTGSLAQADPGGARQQWCLGGLFAPLVAGTLLIYDRLADISGLNATTTTAQTITGLSVSRYTGTAAAGNMAVVDIYTLIGATATTATISYTNQAGTAGQVSPAFAIGATNRREAQRRLFIPLAAGDTGVRSVENVDLLATTATAGDFGITIIRPLLAIPCSSAGIMWMRDLIAGLPQILEIMTGACISMAWLASSTTVPEGFGCLSMIEA
jgi:hypothetical protein